MHPAGSTQAEKDIASAGLFCSNFQPLDASDMRVIREDVAAHDGFTPSMRELGIPRRLEHARSELERVRSPEYVRSLVGTIGADPLHRPLRFAQGDRAAVGSVAAGVSP